MTNGGVFWNLGSLSDQELLQGLEVTIRSGRRALAELLAHLAEVEERRLHLRAACPSLFSYCVTQLGFSEDEACRRIEVSRLARRHPALFAALASGEISLSVAALLKPFLSGADGGELLRAVAGKTVQGARELLAARFPQPDVPSVVRKLPERRIDVPPTSSQPAASGAADTSALASPNNPSDDMSGSALSPLRTPAAPPQPVPPWSRPFPEHRPSQNIAPLAPARYKVEFTADAALKAKLDLARDLMRHANPSGEFAPILARALDLLITEIQKRKFGARAAHTEGSPATAKSNAVASTAAKGASPATAERDAVASAAAQGASPAAAKSDAVASAAAEVSNDSRSAYIPRSTRRHIAERDGLRCCWTDGSGRRCDSQAWLEHDHCEPRAKGGGSEPANLRLLCRAHNRLEAERQFGRRKLEREIERAQRARQQRGNGFGRRERTNSPAPARPGAP